MEAAGGGGAGVGVAAVGLEHPHGRVPCPAGSTAIEQAARSGGQELAPADRRADLEAGAGDGAVDRDDLEVRALGVDPAGEGHQLARSMVQ